MVVMSNSRRQYKNTSPFYMKYFINFEFTLQIIILINNNFQDVQCYDKFLSTLLNSSIVRAEAEYWLRNLRLASKVKPLDILGFVCSII